MQEHQEVVRDLVCQCGAEIITDGKLTCPRCHQSVNMASSQDVLIDEQGRWKCQKCLEHNGESRTCSRTLAIGNKIKCRQCDTENSLIQKEEEMRQTEKVVQGHDIDKFLEKASRTLKDRHEDTAEERKKIEIAQGLLIGIKRLERWVERWGSITAKVQDYEDIDLDLVFIVEIMGKDERYFTRIEVRPFDRLVRVKIFVNPPKGIEKVAEISLEGLTSMGEDFDYGNIFVFTAKGAKTKKSQGFPEDAYLSIDEGGRVYDVPCPFITQD